MTERDSISGSSRDYGSMSNVPNVGFAGFSPSELYNVTEGVADNINAINSGLKELDKKMKQIGGPNDSVQLRDKIHDMQQRVNSSVSAVTRDLNSLSQVVRRGDKEHKLRVERLMQAFKDALAYYETTQRQVSEKMAAHMPRAKRPRNDPQALEQQAIADDEEATLLANQQAQTRLAEFETSMLIEKEAYMNKIEADVLDVSLIIQDLNTMVNEQKETIETIDSHIEAASADVETGVDELAKAAEHQRRYRRKMFILSIIGLVLLILFIVWIVHAFK